MTPEEVKRLVEERRAAHRPKAAKQDEGRGYRNAYGHVADLVSGVAVGALLGYWFDQWFGTKPIMLIICIVFGSAAGFMMVVRGSKDDTSTPTLGHEDRLKSKK